MRHPARWRGGCGARCRQRGAGLLDGLLGLALGLLVLQGLVDALSCAWRTLQAQREALLQREARELLPQLLRAVVDASRTRARPGENPVQPVPHGLRVLAAAGGPVLEARFAGDAAPGACGEAPRDGPIPRSYRLAWDAAGTLHCSVDLGTPRPMLDGGGPWELEFVETTGTPGAQRLRIVRAEQVRDWQRVALMHARLPEPARAARPSPPCLDHWVALAPLDAPRGS